MRRLAVVSLLLLALQARAEPKNTFTLHRFRFTIDLPDEFTYLTEDRSVPPVESFHLVMAAKAPTKPGMVIMIVARTSPGDFEAYKKTALEELEKSRVPSTKVLSTQKTRAAGKDALLIEFQGGEGQQQLRHLSLAVLLDKQALVVNASAAPKDWAGIEKAFRSCLESVRFEEKK